MFGKDKNMKNANTTSNEITTLIGEGCLFEGDITSPSSTRVDGNVVGNIKGKGNLIIGDKGVVSGEVRANEVIVYGKIEGNVDAERLEIKKGGSVYGDVSAKALVIEDGGTYNGKCVMETSPEIRMGANSKAELESTQAN